MARVRRPKVIKFPKPKLPDDSRFITTLVWALDAARSGKVKGYAAVFVVENDDGTRSIELADVHEHSDHLHLLGCMREMEHDFIQRMRADQETARSGEAS